MEAGGEGKLLLVATRPSSMRCSFLFSPSLALSGLFFNRKTHARPISHEPHHSSPPSGKSPKHPV